MAVSKGTILLIEDDPQVVALVCQVLGEAGFDLKVAETIYIGRNAIKEAQPSLVIMDRKLPDADGLEFCAELRQEPEWRSVPILFLTAMKSPADKIAGLRGGGDDYLGKPFSSGELLARVQALLRRSGQLSDNKSLRAGKLRLDLDARKAYLEEKEVQIWGKEFELLMCFIKNKNRVLARSFIMQQVWDYEEEAQPSAKVVDVLISHLRGRLGDFGGKFSPVRGIGYRLDVQD